MSKQWTSGGLKMFSNYLYSSGICCEIKNEPLLCFVNEISVGDIISFLSLVTVIVGGCFGYYQWQKSIKIKRAEYLNELTEKIRTDPDISEVVYILDYNQKWYDDSFHESGELERKVDKTLSYFSYICYLFENKLITKNEFAFFKYEIDRILVNYSTIRYFYNIYHFSNKHGTPMTFKFLFNYGEKAKIFDSDFYNARSDQYPHYLNF